MDTKINYKDIYSFFQLREEKDKLVIIRLFSEIPECYDDCNVLSILWGKNIEYDDHFNELYTDYIGPKTEQNQMIEKFMMHYVCKSRFSILKI